LARNAKRLPMEDLAMFGRLLGNNGKQHDDSHAAMQANDVVAQKTQSPRTFKQGFKPRQVAEILNCHVCTVRRYIADGRLTAHRLSARSLIILDCDLERFLADREVKAAA